MRSLDRKLLRDLWHLRGQVFATALVVACGVASFVAMRSTYGSLVSSRDRYYAEYLFADVFASLKRAPESVRKQLAEVPGVSEVQTRVAATVTLDIPDLPEPAQGKLVSIGAGSEHSLNRLFLLNGRMPEPARPDEVVISGAFAQANRLRPGDKLRAVLNGRLRPLNVVGVALSPEYIYEIRPGDIFPDNRRFGIIWMNRKAAAAAFELDEAFNDLAAALAPEADEGEVIAEIDRILEPYGGFGAYGRADQYSHRFITNELAELQVHGTVIPAIFLGVTAFLLHLVLSRLVAVEREQIGLLKAFGYSNAEVGLHYLKLSIAAIAGGIVMGVAIGAWMGSGMNSLYADFFHFPVVQFTLPWNVVAWSFVISVTSAAAGAVSAVRKAAELPPAEAMRPEPPASFGAGPLEALGLRKYLPVEWRIAARNLSRQPVKALLASTGISLAVALLFIGFYFFDAIGRIIDVQFANVQREDAEVSFNEPRSGRTVLELASMPGVMKAEPFRAVPAILRSGNHHRRVAVMGMKNGSEMRRIVDKDLNPFFLPGEGIVLGATIAESLGVREGDRIMVEVTEGSRPVRELTITAVVEELLGLGSYMELAALHRMMDEESTVSGAFLQVDENESARLYSSLKRTPGVSGVAIPKAALASFNDTMAKTIGTSSAFMIAFACVIAFGIVYNGTRIALAERGREFASLRVLGFTQREVAKMLLGEQAVLTAAALPIGFLLGSAACFLITKAIDTEIVRLPMVLSARTFFSSAAIVVAAAVASGFLVSLRIKRMDLITVLKTRE